MTKEQDLILYSAPWCPYCVALMQKLDARDVGYEYRDVDDPVIREEMNRKTNGNQTIPVLSKGDQFWVNPNEQALKEILHG